MNGALSHYIVISCCVLSLPLGASSDVPDTESRSALSVTSNSRSFEAFTGKIGKDRVRLRTKAHLGASIVKEVGRGTLLVAQEEEDEFYAVEPPSDVYGYVYRTFVLDGVVEGNHVNVRLGPATDQPVVTQLNTGDKVEGELAAESNKWLRIKLPRSTRFYVAKEYLSKVGGPDLLSQWEERRQQLQVLLEDATVYCTEELAKSFDDMDFDSVKNRFQLIIDNYSDFKEETSYVREQLLLAQDAYLQKKISFLEEKAGRSTAWLSATASQSKEISAETLEFDEFSEGSHENYAENTQSDFSIEVVGTSHRPERLLKSERRPDTMTAWDDAEERYFAQWAAKSGVLDKARFQHEEELSAIRLQGIVESYHRPVKNKPGNFLLRNSTTRLPGAYLYSTAVDLQDMVGKEVTLVVVKRPNNHFAFPAYFVISCEQ